MCVTLIVEDNDTFRQSLRELLQSRFPLMRIAEAADGMEALKRIQAELPDIIFIDIKLPGTNGLDLMKRIRSNDCQSVVVVLTSYDLPEYREAAYRCGANFFLTKGDTSSLELLSLVDTIMPTIRKGERSHSALGHSRGELLNRSPSGRTTGYCISTARNRIFPWSNTVLTVFISLMNLQ